MPKMEKRSHKMEKATLLAGKIEAQTGNGTRVGKGERKLGTCLWPCPKARAATAPAEPRLGSAQTSGQEEKSVNR